MLINFQNNLTRDGVDFLSFGISKSGFFFFPSMCFPVHPWDIDNAQELPARNLSFVSRKRLR